MFKNLIQIILAIGLLKDTFGRNLDVKTLVDIENILRSVDHENVDDPDDVPSLQERNNVDLNRNIDDDDGEDRIDIDSLIKRVTNQNDNDQFNDDDFDRFLRNANENLCRKIGRCGCDQATGRCGKTRLNDQQTVDEIQRLIDDLDDRVDRDDDRNDDRDDNRDDDRDTSDRDKNRNDIDYKHHVKDLLSIVRDDDEEVKNAKTVNKIYDEDQSPDNRLDLIMINNLPDLGDLLKKIDLSKSDKLDKINVENLGDSKDRSVRIKSNRNDIKAVIVDLSRYYNESRSSGGNADLQRSIDDGVESSNPDEFFQHFVTLKEKLLMNFVDFVMHKNANKPNLSPLTNTQKRKIRILKGKMRTNKENLTPLEVKREVNDIIFGKYSNIKFVPSEDNSNKIVVPKWIYKLILRTTPKPLRTPKRILPLTYKQKKRLNNGNLNLSQSPAISTVWRRSLGQDLQRYGVPFELAVQGLAQYNDE